MIIERRDKSGEGGGGRGRRPGGAARRERLWVCAGGTGSRCGSRVATMGSDAGRAKVDGVRGDTA